MKKILRRLARKEKLTEPKSYPMCYREEEFRYLEKILAEPPKINLILGGKLKIIFLYLGPYAGKSTFMRHFIREKMDIDLVIFKLINIVKKQYGNGKSEPIFGNSEIALAHLDLGYYFSFYI